jgi:hypothetical protein
MHMKSTTGIYGPIVLVGKIRKGLNFVKAGISGKDGRNEFFPRNGAIMLAAPRGTTVKIGMIVAIGGFDFNTEFSGRTNTNGRTVTIGPFGNVPSIAIAGTIAAKVTIANLAQIVTIVLFATTITIGMAIIVAIVAISTTFIADVKVDKLATTPTDEPMVAIGTIGAPIRPNVNWIEQCVSVTATLGTRYTRGCCWG